MAQRMEPSLAAYYSIFAQTWADSVFNALDPDLGPRAAIVTLKKVDEKSGWKASVCVEGGEWEPIELKGQPGAAALALAAGVRVAFPEEDGRQVVVANEERLAEDQAIFLAIGVKAQRAELFRFLEKGTANEGWKVPRSLVEATMAEFVETHRNADKISDPQNWARLGRGASEVIRSAGRRFMWAPGWIGWTGGAQELAGLYTLFDSLNVVSGIPYEGEACSDRRLVIARPEHPAVETVVTFDDPITMADSRGVRKLLQMSGDGTFLLSDSWNVFGLGRLDDGDWSKEDLFVIDFLGAHRWNLCHSRKILMSVSYGVPSLPEIRSPRERAVERLEAQFPSISSEEARDLAGVVEKAAEQVHGTTLVVTAEAPAEAERLRRQGTKLKTAVPAGDAIRHLTSIDGAVLVDLQASCHAIGVILDGPACDRETSSRGARFNSSLRYVESRSEPCLVVVVSADRTMDFISRAP